MTAWVQGKLQRFYTFAVASLLLSTFAIAAPIEERDEVAILAK